ncbi:MULTISPECIES: ABC transporter ATP-binding protein [Rummeliibacillus]|uniref:ABC transporter ATP-binding protein n=1 Tax=Rummeliibacillus TaxID=648802 RepID=UPI0011B73CFF|nr:MULTISPECIES: ABC transporter ATP-binding protein [Rummeliibacillus]MBO2535739.1 ABC transporter ATP-binding protein [Rummeliibacillus suwonensis]
MQNLLVEVENLKKNYTHRKLYKIQELPAVSDVSLLLRKGETLGLVGESGSGKSTLGQLIGQLLDPTEGIVLFEGQAIEDMTSQQRKRLKKDIQYVFQDAYSSLNPRHKVSKLIEEPLIIQKIGTPAERKEWVNDMLNEIGLDKSYRDAYIHELSGGQRQRIGIARALILKPKLLVLDEPVSALDVSVQSQILNLLKSLQQKYQLTYMFISHDLNVVHYMSDRIAVMYLGEIIELANVNDLYEHPLHPYTKALISAIPTYKRQGEPVLLKGEIASATDIPNGCSLHPRCPFATEICQFEKPVLEEVNQGQYVSCHLSRINGQ